MLSHKKNKTRGFTIVELLAVMAVISIGLVGITNIITQIFSQSRFISSKLVAAYLAQEGIEIVRNIRDTNWLEGAVWDEGIDAGDRQADYNDQALSAYQNTYLKLNGGFYNYDSGNNTEFKRKITIAKPGSEILVQVTIYWDNHEIKAVEKLYNWR